jgi:16S rRNA (cytosine967-C5)-methyltransferase
MSMTSGSGSAVRVVAARVLDAVLQGRSLKAELAAALPGIADPRDRALVEAICFAALRNRPRYEAALAAWMPRPLGRRDAPLRAMLYVGLAQLDPLRLPAHAALAATVDAVRETGRAHQAGLANALLRRAQREGLPAAAPDAAWPAWLRGRVRADWPGQAEAIFEASAVPGPTWLRVNRLHGSREHYAARLDEAGIAHAQADDLPDALRIDAPVSPTALPGFAQGDVSVQDAAAQRVADALAPAAGARVLDACAAPGGKSAHLLERDPGLRLTALDVDARRLARVRETLARLGLLERATLLAADAARPDAWWDGQAFDAILLDAPCSGTGIVRRQPDVLLHRREADLAALTALQARLLDALWPLLAPGGRLLYATCSILQAENAGQVGAFLSRTADARVEPLDDSYGHAAGAGRQRLPGEHGMDGFFYARLRKDGSGPATDGAM